MALWEEGYVASEHTPEAKRAQEEARLREDLQLINDELKAKGQDPRAGLDQEELDLMDAVDSPVQQQAAPAQGQDEWADLNFDNLLAQAPAAAPEPTTGKADAALTGFNTSMGAGAEGALQVLSTLPSSFLRGGSLLRAGKVDAAIQQVHAQEAADYAKVKKEHPIMSRLGYGLGEIGKASLIPSARGAGFLGRAATGGLGSGAMAQTDVYATPADRLNQTGMAMGTGAVLSGVLGKLGSNRGVSVAAARPIAAAGGTVGQITGKPSIQGLETTLSKVPVVGMRGKFQGQVKQVIEQVDDFIQSTNPKSQQGSSISPAQLKSSVVNGLSKQFSKAKTEADTLYGMFSKAASKSTVPVETTTLGRVAKSIIGAEKQSPILGDKANTIIKAIQPFTELENLKPSQINAMHKTISDLTFKMKAIGPEEGRAASRIFGAWNDDLAKFSKSNPQLGKLFDKARETYKTKVGSLMDDPVLSQAIKGKIDPDQLLSMAVKNERPELIRNVMKNLTPSARGDFRQAIMKNVYNDSLNDSGVVDPMKFFRKLNTLGETLHGALAKD